MKTEHPAPSRTVAWRWKLVITIACFGIMAVLAMWLRPRDAQYYINRGEERLMTDEDGDGSDPQGALADFNRAIRLDPHFAAAYRARGQLEEADGALADFTKAIELEPTNKLNYIVRAEFWEHSNNLAAALADLTKAIQFNPKEEDLFMRRASLRHRAGDFSGMVADIARAAEVFTPSTNVLSLKMSGLSPYATNTERLLTGLLRTYDQALAQNTNFFQGYYHRGVLEGLADRSDDALADFQRCQMVDDAKLRDDAAFQTWLVLTKQNEKETADRELANHFGNRLTATTSDWEAQIAKFLLGQIDEATFLTAAGGVDAERERSEAWFYAGMKQLVTGNKAQAAADLQKSRQTETRPYAVAISSQIELTYLGR